MQKKSTLNEFFNHLSQLFNAYYKISSTFVVGIGDQ